MKRLLQINPLIRKVALSMLIGIYTVLFALFFQPFGIAKTNADSQVFIILSYGLITFVLLLANFGLFQLIGLFIKDWKHNLVKHGLFIAVIILAVSSLIWLFNDYKGINDLFDLSLYAVLFDIVIMSIFPIIISVFAAEKIALEKHLATAEIISEGIHDIKQTSDPMILSIVAENQKNKLEMTVNDFLCIQGSDNYSTVYYHSEGKMIKALLRLTLKNAEDQFTEFEEILRCHKSFIVNIRNIEKVSGNAQGYKLHFKELDFQIPVSRTFPKSILNKLKKIK